MPADPDRQAAYDQIRQRFVEDPDFREELRRDLPGTLARSLGELTDEEQAWVDGVVTGRLSEDELLEQIQDNRVRAW